jgi:carbonic anhydrase/acetyltransferase-like protein (isoleucine patch superfamily)
MDRLERRSRRSVQFRPENEVLERKQLLSGSTWPPYVSNAELYSLLHNPVGYPAVRPNTPVLPYGTASKLATYIDPAAKINNGYAVIVGAPSFIAPYANLNAHGGIIKIGSGTDILDNASIVANPLHPHTAPAPQALLGDHVLVSYGAQILGPSTIGAYGSAARETEIGPGALIDQANVEPGAIVSALARVGPGVTVPSGYLVLQGKNVTTNAEASDPGLGMVRPVTSSDLSALNSQLAANQSLGTGYNTLYQGQSATGASVGIPTTVTGIFNGNLATVLGANSEPGSPTASTAYLPAGTSPKFPSATQGLVQVILNNFPARITGAVVFNQLAGEVAHRLGRSNSIRADMGETINIGSIGHTGNGVTINSPGGALTIGQNFVAGNNATILGGGSTTKVVIGDNVTIGNGAVVSGTSLGSGSTVGAHAYLLNSAFPAGKQIPAGAIYDNNKLVGYVAW